jgi:NAD(P)-dependent dehydrogenase (short-subunit alcohol dehydrogenase family)
VLAGRDPARLREVETEIAARPGGRAVSVVADFSDIPAVRRAATEIAALGLPLGGLLNNAGIFPTRPGRSPQGWDLAFATNHLGPFAFTEALIPHLPDGANVVFTASGVEDPDSTRSNPGSTPVPASAGTPVRPCSSWPGTCSRRWRRLSSTGARRSTPPACSPRC